MHILDHPEEISQNSDAAKKAIYYAFVELENIRSRRMVESAGFETIRQFVTIPFSRFYPKKHSACSRIEAADRPAVLAALKAQYLNFNLYFSGYHFIEDNYFVFRKDGKIVAGLQARPAHWKIEELPGLSGKFAMRFMPCIPLLSRLFNPQSYRFLTMGDMFFEPGHEAALFQLMESALAAFGHYSALIWQDLESPLVETLRQGKLGLLHKLQSGPPANVVARAVGYSASELADLQSKPLYVSPFDLA